MLLCFCFPQARCVRMADADTAVAAAGRELHKWLSSYLQDCAARVDRHQKEITKLELDVECNPLSAQFSQRLCALME